MPRAFDLLERAVGHAGRLQKVSLHRPPREHRAVALQRSFDSAVTSNHTARGQPLDERLRIVEVEVLPGLVVEPETAAGR